MSDHSDDIRSIEKYFESPPRSSSYDDLANLPYAFDEKSDDTDKAPAPKAPSQTDPVVQTEKPSVKFDPLRHFSESNSNLSRPSAGTGDQKVSSAPKSSASGDYTERGGWFSGTVSPNPQVEVETAEQPAIPDIPQPPAVAPVEIEVEVSEKPAHHSEPEPVEKPTYQLGQAEAEEVENTQGSTSPQIDNPYTGAGSSCSGTDCRKVAAAAGAIFVLLLLRRRRNRRR